MEVSQDTLPELQRIFTFLNSHSNKLYQEGYFLKFHDTDSRALYPPFAYSSANPGQVAGQLRTGTGKNASPSLLVQFSLFGMPAS
jgi:hypothetical protein